jgi:hypothetical protein
MGDRLVDRHHVLSLVVSINSEPPTVCLQRLTVGDGRNAQHRADPCLHAHILDLQHRERVARCGDPWHLRTE